MTTNLHEDAAQHIIPGAYDRTTLTHRQPGSMGGAAFGSAHIPAGPRSTDAATMAEHEVSGGGRVKSIGGRLWFQLLRLVPR